MPFKEIDFTGKKVCITGSSRGIGRATALAMAEAGADVIVHYRRDRQSAEAVVDQIRTMGRDAIAFRADLENIEEIDQLFDVITERWGHLDVFIGNAAATAFKPLESLTPYHFDRTFHVVVTSILKAAQRCRPLMEDNPHGGRIIVISSMGSRFALPRYASLGTSKAALESLVRYIAMELGPFHITCNALSPGVVDTDSVTFYAQDTVQSFHDDVSRQTPLGQLARPEDIADAIMLLATDHARYITGQTIVVDGGLTLTPPGYDAISPE
ncbi:SDR family oxidoreductase [Sulfobacillus thermosulfidooxidans]|uniref:SDR family oxidoreductase n=1 Tax=Sulfobacillus thermosulfidooxidans TaxID=28034 RepID=UPI0006B69701|nr:SDR family oxidoreductase [Sulfobacillus thermosulfidooxidans]